MDTFDTAAPTPTKTNKMLKPEDPVYKTALCKNFEQHGKCKYGKRCTFAHGKDELCKRPLRRPQRWPSKHTLNEYLEAARQPIARAPHMKGELCERPRALRRDRRSVSEPTLNEPTLNEYLETARQSIAKVGNQVPVFGSRTEKSKTRPLQDELCKRHARLQRILSEPILNEYLEAARQPPVRVVNRPMNPLAPEFQPEGMLVAIECAEMVLSES